MLAPHRYFIKHYRVFFILDIVTNTDDSLNILRERATCPVCTQIYNKPKRLTNCRHVFCLTCIKRYMETKRPLNFPPCPVCRAPIMKAIQDVDTLETAGAEEDIVSAVRKFETCNICQRNESPNQKCLDCNSLICDNCIPSHDQFNPMHTKIGILSLSTSLPESTSRKCSYHTHKLLDLYCIICRQVLCDVCKIYNHNKCKKMCKDWKMQYQLREMFSRGLLKDYRHADEERELLYLQSYIPSLVQLNEFSSHCRRFLKSNIQPELEDTVIFFKEFLDHIRSLIGKEQTGHSKAFNRVNDLLKNLSKLKEAGEAIKEEVLLRIERSSDTEIAQSILDIEVDSVLLFKIRKTFALQMKPLAFARDNISSRSSIYTQVSECALQTMNGMFGGLILIGDGTDCLDAFYAKSEIKTRLSRYNHMESLSKYKFSSSKLLFSLFYGSSISQSQKHNVLIDQSGHIETKRKHLMKRCLIDVCEALEYSNALLEMSRIVYNSSYTSHSGKEETDSGNHGTLVEIEPAGFTTTFPKSECTGATRFSVSHSFSGLKSIDVMFGRPFPNSFDTLTLEIPFVNVFAFPIFYNHKSELESVNWFHFDEASMGCMACLTGNRSSGYGLETIMIHFGECSKAIDGICIATTRMKCKVKLFDAETTNFEMLRHNKHLFSINTVSTPEQFTFSYHTLGDDNSEIETVLQGRNNDKDATETSFSVSLKNVDADLVCFVKYGIYIVNHRREELQINKLILPNCEMETIYSIKEETISVPVEKLIPLTAAEAKNNEVVVVCGIQDDNSKFFMIFPEKVGNESIELLEVRYPNTDLVDAPVIDLEIAPDGTVMFVLEKEEGNYVCVSTKYFIP